MGKTPQLLVTACLGYFVAVACSGAGGGESGWLGLGGASGALGWAGDAGAGLGIEVPDAAAAGTAGGAACDCAAKALTVVVASCSPAPLAGYVECVAEFPGKTAQELSAVRVMLSLAACPSMAQCDYGRQQQFTNWQSVAYLAPANTGYQDGKVTATGPDGVTSATFILP